MIITTLAMKLGHLIAVLLIESYWMETSFSLLSHSEVSSYCFSNVQKQSS